MRSLRSSICLGCSHPKIGESRSSTLFRRNATALCQPRPSAWVIADCRDDKPQRGGPNNKVLIVGVIHRSGRFSSIYRKCVSSGIRATPLGFCFVV